MTATAHPASSTTPPRRSGFRPDIQGLRAIAVLLVVLFHSGVEVLSGGYVGVDVFFVISGFLITTHLLESLEREGRIRFGAFYAKRARRILPASLLVAALTVVAAWIWMSPLLLESVVKDAIATALYVPNYRFALEDTDYLAEATPSAFQHYWSLGIEEQFYLFWPAVLALVFWLCRRSERRVMVAVAVLTAASFLACVLWMDISQPWTFFSLPTRAWELGVGGLVAMLLRSGAKWLSSPRTGLLAWAGLAALLVIALVFDEGTPFPGWTAALPVLATAALIIGGAAPGRMHATAVLGLAPMQFVGAISYSLYLVHWPLQVIPQAAAFSDEPLPLGVRLLLGAAAVPLAWLLFRLVERPAISWTRLREARLRWTGALAAAASIALIAVSGGVHLAATQQSLATPQSVAAEEAGPHPEGTEIVPANLEPSLDEAENDNPAVYASGCHRSQSETDPGGCQVGENEDAPLVFLFGDSHAASWYPALEKLAEDGTIRLDSNTKSSCYSLDIAQLDEGVPYTSCEQWRDGLFERIDAEQPDLVILANYNNPELPLEGGNDDLADRWQEGLSSTLSQIDGPEVAVMKDVPDQQRTPRLCLSQHVDDARRCAVPLEDAFVEELVQAEDAALEGTAAHRVDLTDRLCNEENCPVIIGNTLVYRDGHHLTETFSRDLSEPLWEQLEPLVG
ncbi:acyltransferase family protein [Brachybacterium massiliense]|uniref:acyltransferase family protein n=1 Tax=Brachybacterium massiliense TaxID=1755098 RepID=UPI001FE4DB68|nr:acyltransferase family protein [Brachybacterium massiliense]